MTATRLGTVLACFGLFLVALGLRLAVAGPTPRLGYDERSYARYADAFAAGVPALRQLFASYPKDETLAKGPPPTRIAFVVLSALPCKLAGRCGAQGVLDVALWFGALLAPAAFLVLRRWVEPRVAVVAGILVAVSPLGLAMSQRALQDTFFAVVALGFVGAHDWYWRRPGIAAAAAVGAAFSVALLTKESAGALLLMQVLLALGVYWPRCRTAVNVWPLVLAVGAGGFAALVVLTKVAGDLATLQATYAFYVKTVPEIPYSLDRQGGAWFRYAVDFLMLSPLTLLFVPYAIGKVETGKLLAQLAVGALVFSSLPILNARFVLVLDVLLRGVVAAGIYAVWRKRGGAAAVAVAILALMLASDWGQFWRLFREGGVYDPVTFELARGLGFFR